MVSRSGFPVAQEKGWRRGLRNLLRLELGRWWQTRRWWLLVLLWTALVPGLLAAMMAAEALGVPGLEGMVGDPQSGLQFWAGNTGFLAAIGVIVLMQGVLIGEKESGVAAWILSKPASRASYVISKLLANALGVLVTFVAVPAVGAYLLISLVSAEAWLPVVLYLAATSLIALEIMFYLTLTLMLGTFFQSRGLVVGVALVFVLVQDLLASAVPFMLNFVPMTLSRALAMPVALGEALPPFAVLPPLTPLLATALWTALCVAIAIWRFRREEF